MGAYSFLERKVGQRGAEEVLITSGKIYSAEEMLALGVVDAVAEDGQGEAEVAAFIQAPSRSRNGLAGARRGAPARAPHRLRGAAGRRADLGRRRAALNPRDLKLMQRLVSRQNGLNEPRSQVH